MPSNVCSQTVMVPAVALNTGNGDTVPGGRLVSKTGSAVAPAQVGQKLYLGGDEVRYDATVGTLYGGGYQYVSFHSDGLAYARGQIVFWRATTGITSFDTTNVNPFARYDGNQAGIVLQTMTASRYGWIQVSGLASVLFNITLSKATPAVKDLVVHITSSCFADVVDDATPVTASIHKRAIGVAAEAPCAGTISLVELYDQFRDV